jgi:hypothetical protein
VLLYYALGGGLGHLTRARAVLHTLGIGADVVVLASPPSTVDRRMTGGLRIVRPPAALPGGGRGYRDWLASRVDRWKPDAVIVDTFPAGLFGEIDDALVGGLPLRHVARLLQWGRYLALTGGRLPRFEVTYRVEALDPSHAAALAARSTVVEELALRDPESSPPVAMDLPDRYWLVAHSGPLGEVAELVAYARETRAVEGAGAVIVVATPIELGPLPEGCLHVNVYPADRLFAGAERIVTAAGFNAMRQAAPWRAKHRFIPFPRRFDDQFTRALRARGEDLPVERSPARDLSQPASP